VETRSEPQASGREPDPRASRPGAPSCSLSCARWRTATTRGFVWLRQDPEDPWDAARLAAELAPFLAVHERIRFDPAARRADQTVLRSVAPLLWRVQHVLPDPSGENSAYLEGEIDLRGEAAPGDAPLVRLIALQL
jgi:hypothetical protein